MHDLDRTTFEMNDEAYQYGEFGFEAELPGGTFSRPFSESELNELAMEVLNVQSDQELDEFLSGLFKRIKGFVGGPAGKALGGILRGAVKTALPIIGTAVVPGVGTAVGTAISDALEVGGVPTGNRDLEAAKKLMEVAGTAAQQVAAMPPNAPPQAAVEAVQSAAQQQGIATDGAAQAGPSPMGGTADASATTGRWYRRGRTIIVVGL